MSKSITSGMIPTFETSALPSGMVALASRIAGFVVEQVAHRRSRRAVAALTDQMLADIGLDRAVARPAERYEVSARTMSDLMSMR